MKVSVVVTVHNEEESIKALLDSLLTQSQIPDEIVIVDGGSTDRTVEIINSFNKKKKNIRLFIDPGTIAHGRNRAIAEAKHAIIAQIDAGCKADRDWLKKITAPFADEKTQLVAGFYKMKAKTPFEKALAPFVGICRERFDPRSFMPSGRSVSFRKSVWESVGGYDENLERAGEDTLFNYLVVKKGIEITRVVDAVVEWQVPKNLREALKKFYAYSLGDAQAKIWWHPAQRLASHNIKITLLFARYTLALIFFNLGFVNPIFWFLLTIGFVMYIFWSIWKMRDVVTNLKSKIWLPVIQLGSDLAVMSGFIAGTLLRPSQRLGLRKGNAQHSR